MMRPMWIAVEHIVSVVRPADARLATLPLFWLCGVCLCGRVWRRGCSACGVGGWPWWSWWSPFPAELVCDLCSHGGANNIPSRLAESGCCKLARAACLHVDETRDTSGAFLFFVLHPAGYAGIDNSPSFLQFQFFDHTPSNLCTLQAWQHPTSAIHVL